MNFPRKNNRSLISFLDFRFTQIRYLQTGDMKNLPWLDRLFDYINQRAETAFLNDKIDQGLQKAWHYLFLYIKSPSTNLSGDFKVGQFANFSSKKNEKSQNDFVFLLNQR